VTLVGFSAGGALGIHVAGSRYSERFDRFVVLAPALAFPGNIARPGGGGWAAPYLPRIVGLTVLDAIGVHALNGLDAIAFAVAPERTDLTPTYSYRLAMSLSGRDYPAALRRTRQPMVLLVGSDDEQFDPSRYGPVLSGYKPDLEIRVIPGVRHQSLTFDPAPVRDHSRLC
jgi:pimeloyl-ACP methyl ester carboxylesterase